MSEDSLASILVSGLQPGAVTVVPWSRHRSRVVAFIRESASDGTTACSCVALGTLFCVSDLRSAVFLICAVPADAQSPPGKGVSCRFGAPEGARRYRPGSWGIIEVYAINRTSEQAEAEAVLRFVDDPTFQYARRVSVPPNSVLRTTCPILIPAFISPQVTHVNCLTEQVLPPLGQEAKQLSPQDAMLASKPIILDHEIPAVAMIADLDARANR